MSFSELFVRWYENHGKGCFTTHAIDTGYNQQAYDLKVADAGVTRFIGVTGRRLDCW